MRAAFVSDPAAVVEDALVRGIRLNAPAIAVEAFQQCSLEEQHALVKQLSGGVDRNARDLLENAGVRCVQAGLQNLPLVLAQHIANERCAPVVLRAS